MHNIGNGSSNNSSNNNSSNNRSLVYDGKIAGLYDLEETLGSGHFAVVKLARHVFTGEKVAVKVIDKTKLDDVSRAHLFQEVRCMKLVQHPNVVRLYEVIDTQTKLYLILELGDGGDLYDYIMKHEGGLSENLAREYFRQIVRAISYCHKLHVVHRDLKPENVVFFEKLGVVKLTDFGFSNKFCPGQKLETSCGSLAYSAPEILLGDSYDAPAVDIWSLGVILYMLVCGQPPFEKANDSETLTMIMDCKYTMPAHVSQGCRKLIASMLVRAPEKRATLEQIAKDSWLMEGLTNDREQQQLQQQEITSQPEYLPLISRQQVSEEDHTLIVQRMVNGNIATKEEILEALDRNEYNHITATYFLLAERKLRQKRQEQMQKRRPDLSLPVSAQSRLSPRSRIQGIKDKQAAIDANNQLLVPTSSQISAPRTPGAETHSGGRTRKCSIVQEEEDDEDEIPNCNKHNELLAAPLNRRGSRSEGRINLAVQDKVSNVVNSGNTGSDRLTNTHHTNVTSLMQKEMKPVVGISSPARGIENISGLKYVKRTNAENMRMRLGKPRVTHQIPQIIQSGIGEEITTELEKNMKPNDQEGKSCQQFRSSSLDQQITKPIVDCETKFLVDSSTITIPITSSNENEALVNAIPKYKTMPSPTRAGILGSCSRPLNEIFEEGTDIGSSDTSATTTPRPIIRAHFTGTNRGSAGTSTTVHQHHHRRTKFNKTRTPSCSSSDASDDDSESRKKRAHKMVGDVASKPFQVQRRDSHDDSSDSQDPGTTGATRNTSLTTTTLIYTTNNDNNHKTNSGSGSARGSDTHNSTTRSNHDSLAVTTKSNTKDTKCQIEHNFDNENGISNCANCMQQKTDPNTLSSSSYRRHRNGRRRAGETRLRESQSLNRITEVQESELPAINTGIITNSSNHNSSNLDLQGSRDTIDGSYLEYRRESIAEGDENIVLSSSEHNNLEEQSEKEIQSVVSKNIKKTPVVTAKAAVEINSKPKGFSARLFHGFIRNKNSSSAQNSTTVIQGSNNNEQNFIDNNKSNLIQQQPQITQNNQIIPDPHSADDVDMVLGVIRDTSTNPKGSSATKKLKMLGKYFQVHKKICIPALFHRATSSSTGGVGGGGGGDSRGSHHHHKHKNSSSSKASNTNASDGRLYKAHSCGSIEHNRVNLNPNLDQFQLENCKNNAISNNEGENCGNLTNRHSVLLNNEKSNKILKNCLGSRFLNSSDSDINQNTDVSSNCYLNNGGNNINYNKLKNHCNEIQTTKSFLLSISPHFTKFKNQQKNNPKHQNEQKNNDKEQEYNIQQSNLYKSTLSSSLISPSTTATSTTTTPTTLITNDSNESPTIITPNTQTPPSPPQVALMSSSVSSTVSSSTTIETNNLFRNSILNNSMTSTLSAQNQIKINNKSNNSINNCSNNSSCSNSSNNTNNFNIKKNNINSNSCNNLSTTTISKISSSNSSPHQINDVPLCSSKC
ncbi:serine/threonine-protein kinase fray2 [Condylostylus longicornis]|uniref:serine/threonine-protein kinase fray2 n=1 Tax=Condylostylus longicornis TaxID=2530218 RepID=UPI00244E1072|nr:serine/threonine-protein kinase fray2 [Condylostylus longicornis]